MLFLVMLKCLSPTSASPDAIPVPRQLPDQRLITSFENNPFSRAIPSSVRDTPIRASSNTQRSYFTCQVS
jgi:hypothetical protein